MKKRSIVAVLLLPLVTFGIYGLVWLVKTKNEMNKMGAQIPTAILLLVPIVNIYWCWKYSEGVAYVTNNKLAAVSVFLLNMFLGVIGFAIIQSEFNNLSLSTVESMPQYNSNDNLATPSVAVAEPVAFQQPTQETFTTPIASSIESSDIVQPQELNSFQPNSFSQPEATVDVAPSTDQNSNE